MNDTSRQILSTNKSISTPIAKFCQLTSRFCKILSIKTLFKQKQGIKNTLFKLSTPFPQDFSVSDLSSVFFLMKRKDFLPLLK